MDYREYWTLVERHLPSSRRVAMGNLTVSVGYEEFFRWKWLATKLKIFSFVTAVEQVDANLIRGFSAQCLEYALQNKPGLPRGFQNGVVSNAVIAAAHITQEAYEYVVSRPQKHYSAFETPGIYDLSRGTLLFYRGPITWGVIYESFLRDYVGSHYEPARMIGAGQPQYI